MTKLLIRENHKQFGEQTMNSSLLRLRGFAPLTYEFQFLFIFNFQNQIGLYNHSYE